MSRRVDVLPPLRSDNHYAKEVELAEWHSLPREGSTRGGSAGRGRDDEEPLVKRTPSTRYNIFAALRCFFGVGYVPRFSSG